MVQWATIFPEKLSQTLSTIEYWITSIFFFLALLTIGPWLIFLAYDLLLYLFRTITYEIPVIGGRARGKDRPRAPSLTERPSGDPRVLGIGVTGATYVEGEDVEVERRHDHERRETATESGGAQEDEEEELEEDCEGETQNWQTGNNVADLGFAQDEQEEGEVDNERAQRVFSVGGADEKASWTEVNARRRMGFKEDEEPGG